MLFQGLTKKCLLQYTKTMWNEILKIWYSKMHIQKGTVAIQLANDNVWISKLILYRIFYIRFGGAQALEAVTPPHSWVVPAKNQSCPPPHHHQIRSTSKHIRGIASSPRKKKILTIACLSVKPGLCFRRLQLYIRSVRALLIWNFAQAAVWFVAAFIMQIIVDIWWLSRTFVTCDSVDGSSAFRSSATPVLT